MRAADAWIEEIVTSSRIPSRSRRREIARELRSHVEDLVLLAREAGHGDDEIERMVRENLGDPRQMGRNFAWVYRRERAIAALAIFGLSTLAVSIMIGAGILAVQAGLAIGFGIPPLNVLATRHTLIEALDILATVAVYTGFLSIEHRFDRRGFEKSIALLSLLFAVLAGASVFEPALTPFLIFGFVNALFLRTVRQFLRSGSARLVVVLGWFLIFGAILLRFRSPGSSFSPAAIASWLVMGAGYQLMTGIATRADRAFQRIIP